MAENIAEIMLRDHGKINAMLIKVKELKHNFESAKQEFIAFQWHLEKHLFVEDSAIFSLFERLPAEQIGKIFQLMEQHSQIEQLLKKTRDLFEKSIWPDLIELQSIIKHHSDLEVDSLYKNLDTNLGELQKNEVIKK